MAITFELFVPRGEEGFSLNRGHPAVGFSYTQLRRYATDGVNRNGKTVKLRVFFNPTTLHTTLSEWHRFIDAVNQ